MHVFESAGDLFHEVPNSGLVELKVIALFFFDEFFEVTFLGPFCDDNQLIVVDEGINILDDMGMVQFLHYIDFSQTFLTLSLISHVKNLGCTFDTLIFLRAKGIPCSF